MANLVPLHFDKDTGSVVAKLATGQLLGVFGFTFEQPTPITSWLIEHNGGTEFMNVQVEFFIETPP